MLTLPRPTLSLYALQSWFVFTCVYAGGIALTVRWSEHAAGYAAGVVAALMLARDLSTRITVASLRRFDGRDPVLRHIMDQVAADSGVRFKGPAVLPISGDISVTLAPVFGDILSVASTTTTLNLELYKFRLLHDARHLRRADHLIEQVASAALSLSGVMALAVAVDVRPETVGTGWWVASVAVVVALSTSAVRLWTRRGTPRHASRQPLPLVLGFPVLVACPFTVLADAGDQEGHNVAK